MQRLTALISLAAIQAAGVSTVRAQQREPYAGYDAYVNAALATWKVPGTAIAIVRNDSLIFAKGYGVRELGKPTRVDERTFFAIGSASKAFTAAAVAILVDERKVRWDAPATTYLPGFQLFDPYASREITVRDLLSHRSGLARGDLLWYGTELDRDEILQRVRFIQPSWSFRSQFGYQNLMYLAAGQVVARTANSTWDDVVRRRIFEPLGMTTSNTSIRPLPSMPNVATPHTEIEDTVRVVAWRNIDNIAPAGSINSNVVEMAQWVRLQLNKGQFGERQVITSAQIDEMHKPHTIVPLEGAWKILNPASNFLLYGLGWFLQDFRGKKVVQHGGNIDGMSALVAMMPEERFGIVVLTNMNSSALPYVLMNRTFDMHLKAPSRDWSGEMRKTFETLLAQGREAQKRLEAQRVSGTRPSLPLAQYAGTYVDTIYGEARVSERNGQLALSRGPAFEGALEHWHFDTFRVNWRDRALGKSFVTFRLGASGKVDDFQIDAGGAPATYRRRPDMADTTAAVRIASAELTKYIGSFESKAPPITVAVERLGDQLRLTVPGQPTYTLVPVTTTRFKLTGPEIPAGFFLVYAMDGGRVQNVTLEQPSPRPSLTLTPVR
jgi:CubicO group peptidase (beta-lactamase class C family)